eukprot:scaffold185528_cov51-Attheya_sp.AAC.4
MSLNKYPDCPQGHWKPWVEFILEQSAKAKRTPTTSINFRIEMVGWHWLWLLVTLRGLGLILFMT